MHQGVKINSDTVDDHVDAIPLWTLSNLITVKRVLCKAVGIIRVIPTLTERLEVREIERL